MIEEVARFRLEDVPFTLPARREMNGLLTREQQLRRRVEDALVGLGYVHGIAHKLGGLYHTPHGLANAVALPHVMEFSKPVAASRYADLARVIAELLAERFNPDGTPRDPAKQGLARERAREVIMPLKMLVAALLLGTTFITKPAQAQVQAQPRPW